MKPMSRALRVFVAAFAAFTAIAAHSQSIEVSKERSQVAPAALPFAPPAKPPAAVKPSYVLGTDQPIHEGLQSWAKAQDWILRWEPATSWRTLRETDFSNAADLVAAVTEVIDILRDEGKPVRLRVSDGNRIMEVISTEVTQ